VRKHLKEVKQFQCDAVRRWNPTVDEVSLNNYMGLVAMNEDKSNETGSLILDLAQKMGMLKTGSPGRYERGDDLDALRAYVFGDVKVMDNADKCLYELMC